MSSVIVKGGSPLTIRRPARATRIAQGSKALSPPAGATGATGGAFSFEFDGASQTMEDVTDGTFRLNDATPEDATALAISAALADATDVSALFAARLDSAASVKGRLIVTSGANRLEFEVTSITDNGDWLQLALQNGAIIGALADEDACELVVEAVDRIVGVSSFNGETGDVTVPLREVLTANRTYYVRDDGDDGNDGMSDNAGGAFATPSAACSAIQVLDLGGFNVTVYVRSGSFAGCILRPPLGVGDITFIGDEGTPSNVTITNSANSRGFWLQRGARAIIRGFKIDTTNDNIQVDTGGNVSFGNIECAGGSSFVRLARNAEGACINGTSLEVSGNYSTFYNLDGAYLSTWGTSITFTDSPSVSSAYTYMASHASSLQSNTTISSGSLTGRRAILGPNCYLNCQGGTETYLPGDVASTVGSFSQIN